MKNRNAADSQRTRRMLPIAVALAVGVACLLPQTAHAKKVNPPPVPASIQVQAGSEAFLEGHAVGTQNYMCLPSGTSFAWTLVGPQATLFAGNDDQDMTHFLSPNPLEAGLARATWQDSKDTSAVWARAIGSSSDPVFVAPGAIPWLLLQVVGAEDGPTGGHKLTPTTFIQRLNTSGGAAPATGCSQATDVGARVFVPYEADYFFYR